MDIGGLSERRVRKLEKGVSRLTLEAAEKLANSLEMSLDEFLTELAKYRHRCPAAMRPSGRHPTARGQ